MLFFSEINLYFVTEKFDQNLLSKILFFTVECTIVPRHINRRILKLSADAKH